jgi:hypothetical protein
MNISTLLKGMASCLPSFTVFSKISTQTLHYFEVLNVLLLGNLPSLVTNMPFVAVLAGKMVLTSDPTIDVSLNKNPHASYIQS